MKQRMKRATLVISFLLVLCMCVVFALFYNLTVRYRRNTANSGASHLIEINLQGKENILSHLNQGKLLAMDIADEIEGGLLRTGKELVTYAQEHKTLWGADDVYIYTASGLCVNSEGAAQSNGDASKFAYETVQAGNTLRLVKSQVEYACSVDTALQI